MPQLVSLLTILTMTLGHPQTPPASTFHSVAYFEVVPSNAARASAVAAMKAYNAAVRSQDGFVSFESFEQLDRIGHYAMFETWRDQAAFDKRDGAVQKKLVDALEPVRISDIDRRPYKILTVGSRGQTNNQTFYVVTH